jgi:hypothetical protein
MHFKIGRGASGGVTRPGTGCRYRVFRTRNLKLVTRHLAISRPAEYGSFEEAQKFTGTDGRYGEELGSSFLG